MSDCECERITKCECVPSDTPSAGPAPRDAWIQRLAEWLHLHDTTPDPHRVGGILFLNSDEVRELAAALSAAPTDDTPIYTKRDVEVMLELALAARRDYTTSKE